MSYRLDMSYSSEGDSGDRTASNLAMLAINGALLWSLVKLARGLEHL